MRPQEPKDLREVRRKKGIESGRHLILKKSQKPYGHGKSFAEYVKYTFVPHVARIHVKTGVEQEDAVLLMDDSPSHLNPPVM
jgi:hypothetical protein